jgi:hypothetical protein
MLDGHGGEYMSNESHMAFVPFALCKIDSIYI